MFNRHGLTGLRGVRECYFRGRGCHGLAGWFSKDQAYGLWLMAIALDRRIFKRSGLWL